MPAYNTHDVVESWRIGKVVGHFLAPSALVTIDPISELVGERRRIQTFCSRLLLEQRKYFTERHTHVFDKSKDVVQISTFDPLDNAAQLLCRNLVNGIDGE